MTVEQTDARSKLLELLDLKGVIVTVDAMGCQKKIAGKITEKKYEYNQKTCYKHIKAD